MALQSLKEEGEIPKLVRKWFTKSECDAADVVSILKRISVVRTHFIFFFFIHLTTNKNYIDIRSLRVALLDFLK